MCMPACAKAIEMVATTQVNAPALVYAECGMWMCTHRYTDARMQLLGYVSLRMHGYAKHACAMLRAYAKMTCMATTCAYMAFGQVRAQHWCTRITFTTVLGLASFDNHISSNNNYNIRSNNNNNNNNNSNNHIGTTTSTTTTTTTTKINNNNNNSNNNTGNEYY